MLSWKISCSSFLLLFVMHYLITVLLFIHPLSNLIRIVQLLIDHYELRLPVSRILMAMSRDGLLPPFFVDVNKETEVLVKSTILTGVYAVALDFFMDVSQLARMVSVGTLLAFAIVAVSILIFRYVPPEEVQLPLSLQGSIDSVSSLYNVLVNGGEKQKDKEGTSYANDLEASPKNPFIMKENDQVMKTKQVKRIGEARQL